MTKAAESTALTSSDFDWDIRSTATKWLKRIGIALAAITLLGVVMTFAMKGISGHSLAGIGSDIMIFGAGATGVSVFGWAASKLFDCYKKWKMQKELDADEDLRTRITSDRELHKEGTWLGGVRETPYYIGGKTAVYLQAPTTAGKKYTLSNSK